MAILESHFAYEERRIATALDNLGTEAWTADVFALLLCPVTLPRYPCSRFTSASAAAIVTGILISDIGT